MSNTLAVSQSVRQSYVGTHSKCELQTFVVFFLLHLLSDHKVKQAVVQSMRHNRI